MHTVSLIFHRVSFTSIGLINKRNGTRMCVLSTSFHKCDDNAILFSVFMRACIHLIVIAPTIYNRFACICAQIIGKYAYATATPSTLFPPSADRHGHDIGNFFLPRIQERIHRKQSINNGHSLPHLYSNSTTIYFPCHIYTI